MSVEEFRYLNVVSVAKYNILTEEMIFPQYFDISFGP